MKKFNHVTVFIFLHMAIFSLSCTKSENDFGGSFNANCTPPDSIHIMICKSAFTPGTLTLKKGTAVIWHNSDQFSHNVVSDNSIINSGIISANSNFTYPTEFVGTFQYHCTLHQEAGVLVVEP
jgi:Plastocyanin